MYSDNDFILLGKIVEAISGLTLDQFAQKNFYIKIVRTETDQDLTNLIGRQAIQTETEVDNKAAISKVQINRSKANCTVCY